jgi:hypothetical protein
MDDLSTAYEWAKTYQFDDVELQYITILALKILDNHCKMDYDNYNLFISVYDGIADKANSPFDKKVHKIIELARVDDPIIPSQEYKDAIHQLRVAMMRDMQKPIMKRLKQLVWSRVSH